MFVLLWNQCTGSIYFHLHSHDSCKHFPCDSFASCSTLVFYFHVMVALLSVSSWCHLRRHLLLFFPKTLYRVIHVANTSWSDVLQRFVCILAHVRLAGCSWILFSDWTLGGNGRSLNLKGIYWVSLEANLTL